MNSFAFYFQALHACYIVHMEYENYDVIKMLSERTEDTLMIISEIKIKEEYLPNFL